MWQYAKSVQERLGGEPVDIGDRGRGGDGRLEGSQAAAEKGSPAGKSNFAAFILKDK